MSDSKIHTFPDGVVHIRGVYGDEGENEGVLAIHAILDPGDNYPDCARIVVGAPRSSPLIDGYLPALGAFSFGPDVAELLIAELQKAVAAVRKAKEST